MASVINTNVNSLVAQNALSMTQSQLATATQRLSTGLRINSAKDDAAGLAVSQLMQAKVSSINQAVRNANDGISMLQTAEGGISEQQTILQRMRELAVQASSSTISDTDRGYINNELQQLLAENDAISNRTKFNGQSVLTGSLTTAQSGGTLTVGSQLNTTGGNSSISAIDVSGAKADTFTVSVSGTSVTLTRSSDSVAQTITAAATAASGSQTLNFSSLGVKVTVQTDSGGKTAAGLATDLSGLTVVTTGGGSSATLQVGADATAGNSFSVSFSDTRISGNSNASMTTLNSALSTFNGATTTANASSLLSAVDGALDYLSGVRSTLGANMNRLTHSVANLQATSTNLAAAASRITDADFAAETAALTRANILQQAGTAMLAQANSQPNGVMTLLQRL